MSPLIGTLVFLITEEVKSRHPKITYADIYQVIMFCNVGLNCHFFPRLKGMAMWNFVLCQVVFSIWEKEK